MKTILFDLSVCQPIGSSKFHGGGVYGYIVFEAIANKYPNNIIAYYDGDKYLPSYIKDIVKGNSIKFKTTQECSLLQLYLNNKFDTLYSPLWSNKYLCLFKHNVPIILTQHGLRVLEMNQDYYEFIYANSIKDLIKSYIKRTPLFRLLKLKYLRDLKKIFLYDKINIVTVSEHSKYSILFYYPFVTKDRIKVFYSPNTSKKLPSTDKFPSIVETLGDKKYYLLVSADRWLKNAYRAILAFDKLFESNSIKGKVVVTGISEESKIFSRINNKDRFIAKGYLEREDLELLYKHAYALVYPSLNEGFGYPPIEVMKYGVPIIASSFASISEICGDAPLYVNPYSIDEIAMRVMQLDNPKLYELKRELSTKRYDTIFRRQVLDLEKLVDFIVK